MKTLRILFTILAVIGVVAFPFIGIFYNWLVAIADAAVVLLFFALMSICKAKQEDAEEKQDKQDK